MVTKVNNRQRMRKKISEAHNNGTYRKRANDENKVWFEAINNETTVWNNIKRKKTWNCISTNLGYERTQQQQTKFDEIKEKLKDTN